MSAFDLIVLGCGGGPSESNLSCYLFKPQDASSWEEETLALEAGSGVGALSRLLEAQPDLFDVEQEQEDENARAAAPRQFTAAEVYSWIRGYLITHAHLDHINSLVLTAGSMKGRRSVYGSQQCLEMVESVFGDRIWPKLASWAEDDSSPLHLRSLPFDGKYHPVSPRVSVLAMPLSHGHNATVGAYPSSAFFVRHDAAAREFLFLGDVEPDSVAREPRTRAVWRAAAGKLPHALSAVFIECSWPSGRAEEALYGHLSPEFLVEELAALAEEVVEWRWKTSAEGTEDDGKVGEEQQSRARKRQRRDSSSLQGALVGVCVYVMHCKEDLEGKYEIPMHQVIAGQVQALVDARRLGAEIVAVEQGMQIGL